MKKEVIVTSDGSTSFFLPDWNESYHSKYGAVQEAYHVFIKNGLSLFKGQSVSVLEIGFGTGLNALITFLESQQNYKKIEYTGVEAYPVEAYEVKKMNYPVVMNVVGLEEVFYKIHDCKWEIPIKISDNFTLTKQQKFFHEIADENIFDIIYFDAFGYRVQPELWREEIFTKMFNALKSKGVLVTYACRSPIKKAMLASGFSVEKVPGPPGKREMLIAFKS